MNRRNARRHGFRVPVKPNPQQTRPKANSTGAQSRNRSTPVDLAALTRNIRYRQRARANGLATGDSADTLREKRRWVQTEFDASRINGKATPELHDLYNKRNIGKPQHQRKMAQSLSDAAKEAKRRLEEVFGQRSGLRAVAGAVGHSLGDDSGDAGEMPSATTTTLMALILTTIEQSHSHLTAKQFIPPSVPQPILPQTMTRQPGSWCLLKDMSWQTTVVGTRGLVRRLTTRKKEKRRKGTK